MNGTAVSGNRNGFGILAILIAMTAISIQDALIKGISRDYPLHEIVLIRSVGALPFMLLGCEDCPRPPDNLSVAVDRPGLHQIGPSTSIPRLFV